ncbi:MAG: hypothetical protein HOW97_01225 [Catenulispora sp.]|nr:hypothetical protein [Catenulispora sp.]
MKSEETATEAARVLIAGRSPSVLIAAARLLRDKGYRADATNQFDQILSDYDVANLDVLVFGGMVPPDTKQRLREEITRRNPRIAVVQGLAGIPGVIAAQVEAAVRGDAGDVGDVTYDESQRTLRITLGDAEHVTVEALWGTSFTPPEPTSTSMQVFDGELSAGAHGIVLPEQVPDVASFAAITIGAQVRVLTIGPMPQAVTRLAPKSADDRRLPEVDAVAIHGEDR